MVIDYIDYREKMVARYILSECNNKKLEKMIDKLFSWGYVVNQY